MAGSGALISSSIPNLVNGISQQAYTLRLASQAEAQENCLSTVSDGLLKRPGTKHTAKINSSPIANAFGHSINRDEVEKYIVLITNGNLRVFDLNGVEKTVAFPDGTAYLTSANPVGDFSATTVNDYTFIANKTITVAQSAGSHATRNPEAVIAVRAGNYGKYYAIFYNNVKIAECLAPNGTAADNSPWIDTGRIATCLSTGSYTALGGAGSSANLTTSAIPHTLQGNLIYISSAVDFALRTVDGVNDQAMDVTKGEVQRFSDLPKGGVVTGFTVKVSGDKTQDEDDYYVKWVPGNAGSSNGVWKETVAPGTKLGLNPATMPHILVRESDGTFTFKRATWDNRLVGDITSNPDPSFVGKKINSVFFSKNRLGFECEDSTIFSGAGSYFNFYRTSVQTLLDEDPIDISASHTKASTIFASVPFNKKLLLFSSLTQFVLEGDGILTAKTVSIDPTTEFECDPSSIPVLLGKYVYFITPKGDYSGVMEFFTDSASGIEDAEEITGHIQKYIPNNIFKIAAASNNSTLVLLSKATNYVNKMYVWRSFRSAQERLQNSWSHWSFGSQDTILYADFFNSVLHIVFSRADGVFMEKLDISTGAQDSVDPYPVRLDRRVTRTSANMTYSGGITSITMPFVCNDGEYMAIVDNNVSNTALPGKILPCVWNGTTGKLEVTGQYNTQSLTVGKKYNARYMLSTITYKQQAANGAQKSDTSGRIQVRRIGINYKDTGFFKVTVSPKGKPSYSYTFSGKILGDESSTLGEIPLHTGKFNVPIQSQNTEVEIEITSDSPLPKALLSIDWEGLYVKRSRGV